MAARVALVALAVAQASAALAAGGGFLRRDGRGDARELAAEGDELPGLDWWRLWLLPVVASLIGAVTNWVEIKMTFRPYHFHGLAIKRWEGRPLGLFGWQGIVPAKAKVLAREVRSLVDKLISMQDILKRVDHSKAGDIMHEKFHSLLSQRVDAMLEEFVGSEKHSKAWQFGEKIVREQIVRMAMSDLPEVAGQLLREVAEKLDDIYDVQHLWEKQMVQHPEQWVPIMENAVSAGTTTIIQSGFLFGLLFGVLQGVLMEFVLPRGSEALSLPLFGLGVGVLTNVLSYYMLSRPSESIEACGKAICRDFSVRRQREAAAEFAAQSVAQFLHAENVWESLTTGPSAEEFDALLHAHVRTFSDRFLMLGRPLLIEYGDEERFLKMRDHVEDMAVVKLEGMFKGLLENSNELLRIQIEIREGLEALPVAEFESILDTVFYQEEIKMVLLGGAIGAALGGLELLVVMLAFGPQA